MSAAIRHEVLLNCSPQQAFEALTLAEKFSRFTGGAPAEISGEPGGAFSCFGGMITGRQIELSPGRRIVQAWRAGNWPDGVYSIVRFDLSPAGQQTKLALEHSGFPSDNREHLEARWNKMYLEPLQKFLA